MSEKSEKQRKYTLPRSAWKPGQSGNPAGRKPKADCLLSCIKDELGKNSINGQTKEQMIAAALVQMAERGNIKAIELVLEYTTAKPKTEAGVELKGSMVVNYVTGKGYV